MNDSFFHLLDHLDESETATLELSFRLKVDGYESGFTVTMNRDEILKMRSRVNQTVNMRSLCDRASQLSRTVSRLQQSTVLQRTHLIRSLEQWREYVSDPLSSLSMWMAIALGTAASVAVLLFVL